MDGGDSGAVVNHFFERIHGNFDWQDIYSQAVAEAKDGAVLVEVGAYLGKSTSFLLVEAINSGKRLNIFVVDTWKGNLSEPDHMQEMAQLGGDSYNQFIKNMTDGGVIEAFTPMRMESVVAAQQFANQTVDFVFIDADHRYEFVKADIEAWSPKVKNGGVIAGHDYEPQFPGVVQAVNQAFNGNATIRNKSWWVRVGGSSVGFKSTFTADGVE